MQPQTPNKHPTNSKYHTTSKMSTAFAVIPKSTSNSWFDDVQLGCIQAATELNVTCHYIGTTHEDSAAQASLVDELIDSGNYAGLSISVIDATSASGAIARAREAGMFVVTFDSDAPGSKRQAYIGTDNLAFGNHLGKVLLQIDPTGGTYGIITGAGPNLRDRERGLREKLEGSKWVEALNGSPKYCMDDTEMALDQSEWIGYFSLVLHLALYSYSFSHVHH